MAIIVKGGGGKPEEEKTVTAGTSVIEVLPSSGKVMKKVTVNPTPTESKSVTPTTSELTVTPSEGKHLSQVVVGAVEDVTPEVTAQTPVITQILEGLVGKAQGANITPETVLKGFKGYRGQELVEGTFEPITGIDFGEVVLAEPQSTITVAHGLNKAPSLAYLVPKDGFGVAQTKTILMSIGDYVWYLNNDTNTISRNNATQTKTNNSITFPASTSRYYRGTYKWFALA